MSTADESRLRGQAGTVFPWPPNRNVRSHLILKLSHLLLGLFPSDGACGWSDGAACVANTPLVFHKELLLQDSLPFHHIGNITSSG